MLSDNLFSLYRDGNEQIIGSMTTTPLLQPEMILSEKEQFNWVGSQCCLSLYVFFVHFKIDDDDISS